MKQEHRVLPEERRWRALEAGESVAASRREQGWLGIGCPPLCIDPLIFYQPIPPLSLISFSNGLDMASLVSKRQQARNEKALQELISSVAGNDRCADCAAKNPGMSRAPTDAIRSLIRG